MKQAEYITLVTSYNMPTATSQRFNTQIDELGIARAFFDRGEFEEAAVLARGVYEESENSEMRFRAVLLASSCESERRQYALAIRTLELASPLIDHVGPSLKSRWYGQRAHCQVKQKPDNKDAGLVDYAGALDYAVEAGDPEAEARTRNNLAKRYSDVDRFEEAIKEVDKAIKIGERLDDLALLGRFYDQKAQILHDHQQFKESLICSEKAMRLLDDHPSLAEARTTHGRTLAALAAEYLEQEDPIDTFSGKRQAAEYFSVSLDAELIQIAMDRANHNLTHAAELLNVSHVALVKLVKKFKLDRGPIRRRGKSLRLK